jgi:hypothetical protein
VEQSVGFGARWLGELNAGGLKPRDRGEDVAAAEAEEMVGWRILIESEEAVIVCEEGCAGTTIASRSETKFRVEVDRCVEVGDLENEFEKSKCGESALCRYARICQRTRRNLYAHIANIDSVPLKQLARERVLLAEDAE